MLLIRGSKGLQLLLLVALARGQSYESGYQPDHYDGDEESSYEGSDSPDYSKYYSVDSSAPVIQDKSDSGSGFVSPLEFSSFFGTNNFAFGASTNQEATQPIAKQVPSDFVTPYELQSGFVDYKNQHPFASHDYFEEAQKQQQQQQGDKEVRPGPSYISHKIAAPSNQQNYRYNSEINDLNAKPKLELQYESKEGKRPASYNYDFNRQYPAAAKQAIVQPLYTPKNPQTETPYQKYSYQPVQGSDYQPYASNVHSNKYTATPTANYDFSPSEQVSKLIKSSNCVKVNKADGDKNMDCYVCKDAKSNTNYEQCSYGSEPNPKNYYIETSQKYQQPAKVDNYNYRYKRYSENDRKVETDPYELIKAESQQYYSKPKDFDEQYHYKPEGFDLSEEYRFGPEYFTDESKSSSEQHSENLKKEGENCKKEVKDNMICMVCKNDKTGGNYEQCSYSSEPAEKKYAYVKERKYDSDDDDANEKSEGTEQKPVTNLKGERGPQAFEVETVEPIERRVDDGQVNYEVPEHFEKDNVKNKEVHSESKLHKSEQLKEAPIESPDNDAYYYKFFPKYESEESKQNEQQVANEDYGYYGDEEGKKDVEEVLAEFVKKDRSKCKKAEKNGMTCYLCKDAKGQQHEECMYVSESRPQSKYQAYHAQSNEPSKEESKVSPKEVETPKNKPFPKKVIIETQESKSIRITTPAPTKAPKLKSSRQYRRTKNIPAAAEPVAAAANRQEETVVEPPKEYEGPGQEGTFYEETRPVYSKKLGFSLPKFMLTKSDGERSYDEFVNPKKS